MPFCIKKKEEKSQLARAERVKRDRAARPAAPSPRDRNVAVVFEIQWILGMITESMNVQKVKHLERFKNRDMQADEKAPGGCMKPYLKRHNILKPLRGASLPPRVPTSVDVRVGKATSDKQERKASETRSRIKQWSRIRSRQPGFVCYCFREKCLHPQPFSRWLPFVPRTQRSRLECGQDRRDIQSLHLARNALRTVREFYDYGFGWWNFSCVLTGAISSSDGILTSTKTSREHFPES